MKQLLQVFILSFLIIGLTISCSDKSTGPDPDPTITTGSLEVETTTSGNSTDGDGYTVLFNDNSTSIGINETRTFDDVEEGTYSVELSGLATGCSVAGDKPVSADIVAEETTFITFEVACEASKAEGIVAFVQTVDQQYEIFTIHADGSSKQQLTDNSRQDQSPAISPDGTKIIFVRQDSESATLDNDIWIMDIDGSNQQPLTDNTVDDKRPVWSPDGSKIAYESGDESFSICVINADGSGNTKITDDEGQDHSATWAGSENKIAFISDRQGDSSSDIYRVNPDGSSLEILVDANDDNGINLFDPAWSPDGSQIAYQGFASNGSARVFIADADGANAQAIQPDGYSDARQPAWSPDGLYIAFLELASGESTDTIWIAQIDGVSPYVLTSEQGNRSAFPSWSVFAD